MANPPLSQTEALALVERVDPRYRPVWDGRSPAEQAALALYFLPHHSRKAVLCPTRPRMVKWYCPFAAQSNFPTGHRYCINVYTGCAHRCVYCYVHGYGSIEPCPKARFAHLLEADMRDLDSFVVPPAPVHLSNSTDPFQPLEKKLGHTGQALKQILAHRGRFSTVAILTKNPLLAVRLGYGEVLAGLSRLPPSHSRAGQFGNLPACIVEVSLAFWREEARAHYDPGAPAVSERIEGIRELARLGIPLVLRIDPLLPRSPLGEGYQKGMEELGLPEAQTLDDLEQLVLLAKEVGARHVVYSPMKIVKPKGQKLAPVMQALRQVYERIAHPQKLDSRGKSWRLPLEVAKEQIVTPFLSICSRHGVTAKFCMRNLMDTP